jgi:crotonobetainyl-CoA:carnitine CoA-transferase CaiB-like acyl-CoA transferase
VTKPLGSAAELSKYHDAPIGAEGGLLITKGSAFAKALRAAVWLINQKPGLYDMQDVLGLKEN